MKTVEISQASPELDNLLAQVRDDDLVVRLPDGREFLLVYIDEFDLEIARTRANPNIMALLEGPREIDRDIHSGRSPAQVGTLGATATL